MDSSLQNHHHPNGKTGFATLPQSELQLGGRKTSQSPTIIMPSAEDGPKLEPPSDLHIMKVLESGSSGVSKPPASIHQPHHHHTLPSRPKNNNKLLANASSSPSKNSKVATNTKKICTNGNNHHGNSSHVITPAPSGKCPNSTTNSLSLSRNFSPSSSSVETFGWAYGIDSCCDNQNCLNR